MQQKITISPKTATVAQGSSRQFASNTSNGQWRIIINGHSNGTVDQTGLYKAGKAPGVDTIEVKATDGSTDTAVVTVL
jgi:hypothetical protein